MTAPIMYAHQSMRPAEGPRPLRDRPRKWHIPHPDRPGALCQEGVIIDPAQKIKAAELEEGSRCEHCFARAGMRRSGAIRHSPEAEAHILARCAQTSYRNAASALNSEGITSPTGEKWSRNNLMKFAERRGLKHEGASPRLSFTEAQVARMQLLADEGMPASWIAEDFDVEGDVIRRRLEGGAGRRAGDVSEWKKAWARIRHRPELRRLHDEFAPSR
jgi:hypothetical protein